MNAMEESDKVIKKYSNQLNKKLLITPEEAIALAAALSAAADYRRACCESGLPPNDNNFLSGYRVGIPPYHIETSDQEEVRKNETVHD